MGKKITNIAAEFDKLVPGIAKDFENYVRRVTERLFEEYGNARQLVELNNQWGPNGDSYRFISRFLSTIKEEGKSPYRWGAPVELNEERLLKEAQRYGEDAVAGFVAKLTKKLSDLEDVDLHFVSTGSGEFTISGCLGDRVVKVEQTQVLKVSSRGTPFCQWPARIYVDGKFTSEAEFKKL